MRLFRLAKGQYIADISGTGGLYASGRWHEQGTRILYTSEHLSLAKLEALANSPVLPRNYALLELEVPDDAPVKTVRAEELPVNWAALPYPQELALITRQWVEEGKYWLMRVPSAHSLGEWNYC
ncbi:RES family NAD+ phosphorylase [Hymenobacter koreensis]|uniref:RES domain-containing protein n=1 Tax=Hymenobacter koreensis TaxID=1084523 RepID=A0ABP8J784_9BACT